MRRTAGVFLMMAACETATNDPAPAGTSTGIELTSSSDTGEEAPPGTTSTTGDPGGDPLYPAPTPVDPEGICPSNTFGPITFDGNAWICIPECATEEPFCEPASTGTAEAACATNPYSSADPCEVSADCTVEGELCGNIGDGKKGCLLPPSHCILLCDPERVCPQGMVCTLAGVCAYPA